MRKIVLVGHNIRSAHNVGSLLRTADGLGVSRVCLSGYTPYPSSTTDKRLPHLAAKIDRQIHKTALGAETSVTWSHFDDVFTLIDQLRKEGFLIAALEQSADSTDLNQFQPPQSIALVVGSEVEGLDSRVLEASDVRLEIPMLGAKESFNVAVAAAIAIYCLRTQP